MMNMKKKITAKNKKEIRQIKKKEMMKRNAKKNTRMKLNMKKTRNGEDDGMKK